MNLAELLRFQAVPTEAASRARVPYPDKVRQERQALAIAEAFNGFNVLSTKQVAEAVGMRDNAAFKAMQRYSIKGSAVTVGTRNRGKSVRPERLWFWTGRNNET